MSEMPGVQLDQQRAVQIMRDTPSQATGYLHQLFSTLAAGGQATRHYTRQILCGCRRRFPPGQSVCTDFGQGGTLQTPGGIGDSDRDTAGESPLKTELSTQLDSVKEKLKDPRQPGARLDSATAGVKKATARREKAEETLKQAQEALEQARLQETRAIQELEDAKAAAAPPPPPENPPPGCVSLSSDDVAGFISFFQELADEREDAPGAEPPAKKGRVGPYGETPSLKATKDAAVRAKLERGQAYLGFMLNQSLKSGDGSCQAATQETPPPKGSGKGTGSVPGTGAGKGSGSAPGAGAMEPKDPTPPTPVPEKEKEATQPTQKDEDTDMQDAQNR